MTEQELVEKIAEGIWSGVNPEQTVSWEHYYRQYLTQAQRYTTTARTILALIKVGLLDLQT